MAQASFARSIQGCVQEEEEEEEEAEMAEETKRTEAEIERMEEEIKIQETDSGTIKMEVNKGVQNSFFFFFSASIGLLAF